MINFQFISLYQKLYHCDYQPNNHKNMQVSPTDLTDSQWAKIENLFDNRKRKHMYNFF